MSTAPAGAGDEQEFRLSVNGLEHVLRARPDTPLLYLLRDNLGLKGTRFGCGLGQCGACFVLLDGRATASCNLPVWAVGTQRITTVEGLAPAGELSQLQQAFLDEQAAQCGYCTSGILIAATAYLADEPSTDETAIRSALEQNLCRCGSQPRVIRAVRRVAADLGGEGGW